MDQGKEAMKFYVVTGHVIVAAARPKALSPVRELVVEVDVTHRHVLEQDFRLHRYLMAYVTEHATESFIRHLKADKTTAKSIGGTQWRVSIRDQEFKLFLTRAMAEEYLNNPERPSGPHDRFTFMREMILENYDDSTNSVMPANHV